MRPYHETAEHYIGQCRQAVAAQRQFIEAMRKRLLQHKLDSNDDIDCDLCDLLIDSIIAEERVLDIFNERLTKAKRGLYE